MRVAAVRVGEREGRRESVGAYLTEMRGVLGGALPQAPSFSDHVAALPQEASPAPAAEETSAQSAEPAATGSGGQTARLAARLTGWKIDIHADAESGEITPGQGSQSDDVTGPSELGD